MAWENNKTDIINWHTISEKTAGLILAQGEGLLKETVETAKAISTRSDKLISIQIPILTAFVAYLFGSEYNKTINYLQLSVIIAAVIVFISFVYAYKSFKKYDIAVPGENPSKIASSAFIDKYQNEKQQYLNMVVFISEGIQARVDINIIANKKRMAYNSSSLKILIWLPIAPFLSYLFLSLYNHGFHF